MPAEKVDHLARPPIPLSVRFWAKVDKTPGQGPWGNCWVWTGSYRPNGRGRFFISRKGKQAYRVSYLLAHLEWNLESPLEICHKCDNPACVRPSHLFEGTRSENMQDCVCKGRIASGDRHGSKIHPEKILRGEDSPSRKHPERMARGNQHGSKTHPEKIERGIQRYNAKVTDELVRSIRQDTRQGIVIAKDHDVSPSLVSRIKLRKAWAHVEGIYLSHS